jgi:hypothetical protein
VYTQTAGTTTDSGTLAASGGVALNAGSLFGGGTITGNLNSSGIVTPGATAIRTGILTDTGTYTQNAGGILDIAIAGTTAAKFDALNSTTAVLGGTLNLSQLNGFVPTVGSTFKILNFSSDNNTTFATVNGLSINSSEAYTVTYQPTDVLLTVVSTGVRASAAAASRSSAAESRLSVAEFRSSAAESRSSEAEISAVAESRASEPEIPAARDDNLRAEYLIRSDEDRGAHLTAALREFNAGYAPGGRQAVAVANEAVVARQRVAERIGALDRIRQGKH